MEVYFCSTWGWGEGGREQLGEITWSGDQVQENKSMGQRHWKTELIRIKEYGRLVVFSELWNWVGDEVTTDFRQKTLKFRQEERSVLILLNWGVGGSFRVTEYEAVKLSASLNEEAAVYYPEGRKSVMTTLDLPAGEYGAVWCAEESFCFLFHLMFWLGTQLGRSGKMLASRNDTCL